MDVPAPEGKFTLHAPFWSYLIRLLEVPQHWWGQSSSLSVPIQMLTPSRNTFTNTPRNSVLPGHCLAQSRWYRKLTITLSLVSDFIFPSCLWARVSCVLKPHIPFCHCLGNGGSSVLSLRWHCLPQSWRLSVACCWPPCPGLCSRPRGQADSSSWLPPPRMFAVFLTPHLNLLGPLKCKFSSSPSMLPLGTISA